MSVTSLRADWPVTLLPVRLETRWVAAGLAVRIYPDAISVTRDQRGAAVARLLPESWRVTAYPAGGLPRSVEVPVQSESLAVAVPPTKGATRENSEIAWLTDFDRAVEVGMAVVLPMPAQGIERLVVVGVRSGRDGAAEAEAFAGLLRTHAASDDLGLLPPGTPTNNSDDRRTPWTDDRGPVGEVFAPVAQDPAADVLRGGPGATTGAALAYALGLPPGTFADLEHADRTDPVQGRAMQALLFDATWGELLGWLIHPASVERGTWDHERTKAARALDYARRHVQDYVRGGGPLGVLRVGRQPYGMLPITGRKLTTPVYEDRRFLGILDGARRFWEDPAVQVPKLGDLDDARSAAEQLLAIIGQGPVPDPDAYQVRTVSIDATTQIQQVISFDIDPEELVLPFSGAALDDPAIPAPHPVDFWNQLIQALGWPGLPLVRRIVVGDQPQSRPSAERVVADDTADQLGALWSHYSGDVIVSDLPTAAGLLGHLAIRSLALATLRDQGKAFSAENSIEPVFPGHADVTLGGADVGADVGAYVGGSGVEDFGTELGAAVLGGHLGPHARSAWTGLGALVDELWTMTTDDLVRLTGETLACTATRLDAWITSVATRRLDQLRSASSGVQLGYWGVLCDVPPPGGTPVAVGATLAPSVEQARTAAVLRAAELQHGGAGDTLADIDLTSSRARTARDVLESVGAGMPLASVLGVRLEQGLYAAGLADAIAPLRTKFPQRRTDGAVGSPYDGPTVPQEVADGVDVVAATEATLEQALPDLDVDKVPDVLAVVAEVRGVADAVADALVAEGVHHLVADRVDRAGATFEALAGGSQLPFDLDVLRTPVTGTAVSHKVFVGDFPQVEGWSLRAWRAKLAPVAERFAQRLLGPPGQLAGHGLCALDVVAAAALRPGETSPVEATLGGPPPDPVGYAHQLALAGAAHAVLAGARPARTEDIAEPPLPVAGHVPSRPVPASLSTWAGTVSGLIASDPDHPLVAAVEAVRSSTETGPPGGLLTAWARDGLVERLVAVARRAGGDACVPSFDCELPTPGLSSAEDPIRAWVADHGRVRDAAAALDDVLLFAELEGRPLPLREVEVASVHAVVAGPTLGRFGDGALVVDDFLGVVPDPEARLGLAMRYDAPNARPPQTVLLAVHPDFSAGTAWSFDVLDGIVREAVDLAVLRLVEPEDLRRTGADRLLPFALLRDGQAPIPDVRRG